MHNVAEIAWNPELLEAARLAIEDELVYRRNDRISTLNNNGLCIKEYDGTPSPIIRMSIVEALQIALDVWMNPERIATLIDSTR